ncbi:isocitrate dehydrogenase [Sulfolobus islandicus L.S.2.15]|uniref:Isocitrate dehydrogenase n=1 Tax=Saccharolobus islandicus (strain L.S.2.15 / Lassen \|nr:isocitrate dehydrogenase [Sulfolobus islandicus L.S.2.15]
MRISPTRLQKMLITIATIDELIETGYSKAGAYKVKERGVISDEKCEKLVEILGYKARPVLIDALKIFAIEVGCYISC